MAHDVQESLVALGAGGLVVLTGIAAAQLSTASGQRTEVIALAVIVCGLIFELIRRKRLMERYALLWLLAAITILVLGLWKGLLTQLSHAVGIYYPPSALFAVAFVFVLALLVHFSITVSHLSEQSKVLAQKLALLEHDQHDQHDRDPQPSTAGERIDSDELVHTS